MRVHIVNGEIAVDVVSRTFVTAHGDGCSAEVGTTTHAHKALVGFCGNPVAPRLQIFAFFHNLYASFGKVAATVCLECDAVESIGFARNAVFLVASFFAPSTVLAFGFRDGVPELSKVVSSFGHQYRHRIVTLQVLADTRRIIRHHDFTCIAARRRSTETFGLHVEREKQNCSRVHFSRSPNPLGLRPLGKAGECASARKLVARIAEYRSTAPLAEVAALVFPGVVAHCRFRLPATAGIVRFIEIVNLHHHTGGTFTVHAHHRNRIFTGEERHRNKTYAPRLIIFSKQGSIMIKPVTAIGHNPNTWTFACIVSCCNQLRADLVAATIGGIRR